MTSAPNPTSKKIRYPQVCSRAESPAAWHRDTDDASSRSCVPRTRPLDNPTRGEHEEPGGHRILPSTRLPHGRRLVRILLVGRGRLQHAQADCPDDLLPRGPAIDGIEPSNLINNNATILFRQSSGPRSQTLKSPSAMRRVRRAHVADSHEILRHVGQGGIEGLGPERV